MRYAPLLALFTALCCALPTWANGDAVVRKADPRSGMLFPVYKTPAQVLHQQLNIEVRWRAGRVFLEAEGRWIEVRAGKPTASVNGRQVALTKPPVLLNGRVWLHIRDFFAFALYLLDIPPKQQAASDKKGRSLPQKLVRTHFDERKVMVTVILPFYGESVSPSEPLCAVTAKAVSL